MRQSRHPPAICYRAAVRHATQLSGMRSVRPVKGAAHPCASPAILPPSATSSSQACHARAVRTTREGGCAPVRRPRHLRRRLLPSSCLACHSRVRSVRPAKGAAHPCASPAILPPSHPSAAKQLPGVPCTRSPSDPRRGLRTHALAPPSSRHLLPSSCPECHSRAVRKTREGGCVPVRRPRHLPAVCCRAAVWRVTHERGPSD
jgi:hypothetical protein